MKCEHLTMLNFCQHAWRDLPLRDGLTAILGQNGSGKSNCLGAIRFALTGDNPNAGNKSANIYDRAEPSQSSYVKLVFSHAGVRATVQRNLRPSRPVATLQIQNGVTIEGDKEVTAMIEQILGVSTDIINDIVVVAQSDIFGFLDKKPAQRAAQFQKLFHTEKAGVVHSAIGTQLKDVQIPSVGVDIDELTQELEGQTLKLAAAQASLVDWPELQHCLGQIDANNDVITTHNRRVQIETQRDTLATTMAGTAADIDYQRRSREGTAASLVTVRTIRDSGAADSHAASLTLSRMGAARRNQKARQAQTAIIEEAADAAAAVDVPTPRADYLDAEGVEAAQRQKENLSGEISALTIFVDALDADAAKCPTCGTAAAALQGQREEAIRRLPTLRANSDTLSNRLSHSFMYNDAVGVYNNAIQQIEARKTQAMETLRSLPDEPVEELDEKVLESTISQHSAMLDSVKAAEASLGEHDRELARLQGRYQQMEQQLTGYNDQLVKLVPYTTEQVAQAIENKAGWERTVRTRQDAETSIGAAEATITRIQGELARATEVAEEAEMLRGWVDHAASMREIVGKDGAPRFVAQRNLQRLQVGMNEYLEMFGTPYRVAADEGLSFTASFESGTVQPAERLSEGQKVVLALSFRMALNRMFADNVGALYLDEPTAYLDEHHIRGFEPVLGQLRTFSATRGLQCIIVTHERDLAPLFDSVIQL